MPYQHRPVMAGEVVEYLNPAPGKVFVDATLGGGGHAEKLKSKNSKIRIYGFDQDAEAIAAAKARLAEYQNIAYIHDNFANIKEHVKEKVNGILFDLGVSSFQIDEASRGFSLQKDGPLDMRMDRGQKLTAADIVNNYTADELTRIFTEYGEERFAKRISNAICEMRNAKMIETTFQLKEIIEKAIPTWKKRESVTRIFQALRIAVNHELDSLQRAIGDAIELLKPGGRLVVISYHSLEDRIVKQRFRDGAKNGRLKLLTKKPRLAAEAELAENPRARGAKLRAAEKI
ncbi:16S rRNA (cytosine(1402)-N(4))-methyltransferase [candidate division WOR-1 bacterium RIFCSPHIGHO2_01_FULL_53_15]|uniref:Ribosomal RNA small subunit methyltransferase H n=1 Tax=candidate division WOR-1 bacterium RIFCSPHIGHO2_01_FULL_53_15 TaxID=1802564 RepID=A0A1F4Q496_UNCSA|nr:MAG: 16S rRNA (cytosine(1402)-N(4))-methyltransferase [candidate division WOR-1 bacterium RIFCSPHIGHO2_01_FULL_53_15]OGC13691.1 MAG: 16S rRNA (cytosine(1402)-N(4))-methyltransferase [candidate division WOR-1 bacterium RIFCSPHIGHO2_02_FULL_53_26]